MTDTAEKLLREAADRLEEYTLCKNEGCDCSDRGIITRIRAHLATPPSPISAQSAYEECAEMARKIKLDRADILHRRNKRELAEQAFDTALAIEAAIRQRAASLGDANGGWISVADRLPDEGLQVMIYGRQSWEKEPSIGFDTWQMQTEAPVSFSSQTVEIGYGWSENEYEEVTHWQPLPPAPMSAASVTTDTKEGG